MRSFRLTGLFALVVLLVVGFAVYDYRSQRQKEGQQQELRRITSVMPEQVESLEIDRSGDSLVLQRDEGQWRSLSPLEDLLDDFAVETLLRNLLEQEVEDLTAQAQEAVEGVEDLDWSRYGMEEPLARFRLKVRGVGPEELLWTVGSIKAYDGRYYLRRGEDLLLGDEAWSGLIETTLGGLRDRRLWRQSPPINQVRIFRQGELVAHLNRDPQSQAWSFAEVKGYRMDPGAVESWLHQLRQLRVGSFVAEDHDPETLKLYSLQNPEWRIEAGDWWMEVSPRPNEEATTRFVRTSAESFVVTVNQNPLRELMKADLDFRSLSEPFEFELLEVSELRVRSGEAQWDIVKLGSDWELKEADEDLRVDRQHLLELFETLKTWSAYDFVGGEPSGPVRRSLEAHSLELLNSVGQVVLMLRWSELFEDVESGRSLVYLQSSRSEELMRVGAETVKALPLESLVK